MKNESLFLVIFFALSLVIIRIYFAKSIFYSFLIWNLFLAYIPLIISKLIIFSDSKLTTAILLPIWLLFLPNAPYIVTDLLHLTHNKSAISIWYDALLITTFAIIGMHYFYQSIYILQNYFNPKNSYIFYYKAKLPTIIENTQNLFSSKLGYNYFSK